MKKRSVKLTRRLKPTQERAKESVETILATTATLLDEVGLERFNTNLLAERAGIRVRTVYRYFPNKYAVIIALTEAMTVRWEEWNAGLYERLANPRADWKAALRDARIEWFRNARRVPGALSVLQAMNATPDLKDLHFRFFEEMSQKTAAALKARGMKVSAGKLLSVARTVVNITNSGVDLSLNMRGVEASQFLAELDSSLERYLAPYLIDITA